MGDGWKLTRTPSPESGSEDWIKKLVHEFEDRGNEECLTRAQRGCWQHAARRLADSAPPQPESGSGEEVRDA
jgi:hypothetical protein